MGSICVGFDEAKVHALYPEASMMKAMKMWSLPSHKKKNLEEYCESGKYLSSLKIDGYFYWINKTPNHTYLFSRNKNTKGLLTEKMAWLPHIETEMQVLPSDTLLIGEVYIPGKESKDVTSVMGCLAPKARARQEKDGYLHYYINDIVMFDGKDLRDEPFEERVKYIEMLYREFFSQSEYISIANQVDCDIYDTAMVWLDQGEEGAVLRKKDSKYICDGRPAWSSIKVKQEDTVDVVITGFNDPTKEYKGTSLDSWEYWVMERDIMAMSYPHQPSQWIEEERWMGAPKTVRSLEFRAIPVTKAYYHKWKNGIQVGAYDEKGQLQPIGDIASGMTDELRELFAKEPEKYLGMVVEVKCMSVNAVDHSIRHGFLKTLRPDKSADECTFKEIFK